MERELGISDRSRSSLGYFEEIIEMYEKAVVQFAYTYVKDWSVAEDISQEVFLKVYKNIGKFEERSKLKTWLFSITANQCKDYIRSTNRKAKWWNNLLQTFQNRDEVTPETIILQSEENESLGEDLLCLPVKYREVLVLYYYEELSTEEIGQLLKINGSTVRTRLHRGRQQLSDLREGGQQS
ncbi:sigma-70 family RNA polymerase sigma factor [Bacillus sp. AFS015802]|uniref:sigma-70 family RNA polymerase sigma factor n=1 Tax=Bacillus sp. AFS015802 TaxID=2033486 RepID=UPI00211D4962|nr:sigma-70 family RNA polymerase sigma factor [Bacillus sp. AFS015802]